MPTSNYGLSHTHPDRRNLPSLNAIKNAISKELDEIKNSLADDKKQINIDKLISMYSDMLIVEQRGEKVPLMRSEEYRAIVDLTTIVSKTDINGTITYVNDKFCEISGYEACELLGRSHSTIRHPEENKNTYKGLWKKISNKEIWKGRIRNLSKNGKTYWQDAVIIPQLDKKTNEILGFVGFGYEVSEIVEQALSLEHLYSVIKESKDKDQEKLKEIETLNQIILDRQDEAVAVLTSDMKLIKANQSFLKIFNMQLQNGHCISTLISDFDENKGDFNKEWFRNLLIQEDENKQHKIKIADNTFLLSVKTVYEFKILYLSNITKAQEEIDNAKIESFAKSTFLATMSHEIRTPLNGMIPYIDLLLNTPPLSIEQFGYLKTIKDSSENLLRIINDILDFSKIESGKIEIEEIVFDAAKDLESVCDMYTAKASEKGLNLCVYVNPHIPRLMGDSLRIRQICSNLLSNAIKFTTQGEIVFVADIKQEDKESIILEISVNDTGPGISMEAMSRMFQPFSQADNTITRQFGGTGLGLSISKQLVKLMGGDGIKVESRLGKGSSFSFSLELKKDMSSAPLDIIQNTSAEVGVYVATDNLDRCAMNLNKYLNAFKIPYKYIFSSEQCNEIGALFVLSSGDDNINWIDEEFIRSKKVIAIIPNGVENRNKFYSNTTIQLPINGSKIYDALVNSNQIIQMDMASSVNKINGVKNIKYNARILLAEDNITNQNVVSTLLKKMNIDVIIAQNGKEAYEEYIKNYSLYDLILMDIHMPIMDGIEATKSIREYERLNNLNHKTIIALTADAIKTHTQNYISSGMDDFLAKPIELSKFTKMIERYLSVKKIIDNDKPQNNKEKNDSFGKSNVDSKIDSIMQKLELDYETSKMLYETFIADWYKIKLEIQEAINRESYDDIQAYAHQLKGSCSVIGFEEAGNTARTLENLARMSKEQISINDYKKCFEAIVADIELV